MKVKGENPPAQKKESHPMSNTNPVGQMVDSKPKFILLFGPTGSGKSSAFDKYYKQLRPSCSRSEGGTTVTCRDGKLPPYFASVDNFVENDRDYRKEMGELSKSLLEKLGERKYSTTRSAQRLLQQSAQEMTKLYFHIRKSKQYNEKNELEALRAVEEKRDVVFEITGTNPITIGKICRDKLFENAVRIEPKLSGPAAQLRKSHDLVVVVPFVSYHLLEERIVKRFQTSAKKNPQTARMVPVSPETLQEAEEVAFRNLVELITKRCVRAVVVYDNMSGPEPVEWFRLQMDNLRTCVLTKIASGKNRIGSKAFMQMVAGLCEEKKNSQIVQKKKKTKTKKKKK